MLGNSFLEIKHYQNFYYTLLTKQICLVFPFAKGLKKSAVHFKKEFYLEMYFITSV